MAPPLKVAVIGAGVAGLATARALKREGQQVTVYEKHDRIGGTWVYDPRTESDPLSLDPSRDIVHGSLYKSLRTNLPRGLMGFTDYPFSFRESGDPWEFPGHEEVLEYLKGFARDFGLLELIRFDTEVVRVERVGSRIDEWVVESRRWDGSRSKEVFDAVVVCNGHHTRPRVVNLPGIEKWPGKQIHSHNYRVPEPFKDQIVVVIGDGPSGIDISLDVSKIAEEVHLSSRSAAAKLGKLACADNMWQHSKIDYVDGNGDVAFGDGSSVRADSILYCTGYKYDFPFLKTEEVVTDGDCVEPLYKHVFPPKLAPNLSFVGLAFRSPVILLIDLEAKWVAHVLSGKAPLPSKEDMMAEVQKHYQYLKENGIPRHYTHCLHNKIDHLDWLANQAGLGGVDQKVKLVHKSYYKFIADEGGWRHKEYEPGYGLQQDELLTIQSDLLQQVKID